MLCMPDMTPTILLADVAPRTGKIIKKGLRFLRGAWHLKGLNTCNLYGEFPNRDYGYYQQMSSMDLDHYGSFLYKLPYRVLLQDKKPENCLVLLRNIRLVLNMGLTTS